MSLTAAQQELQERARALARDVIGPRAADVDRTEQYPWQNVEALKAAGFLGMTIPQEYGGAGLGILDAILVVDEMSQVCGVTGRIVVEANMGAISAVMQYGTEPQKRLAADLVLSGDKPAICITEPEAGSAATEMTTRADRRGSRYVLNGRKHWITGGGVSRLHLVFARVFDESGDELGFGGFLVVRDQIKGLVIGNREPTMGLRGIPETEVIFENMEVGEDQVLMPPSGFRRGFADLMNAYNTQRVGAAAVALGLVTNDALQIFGAAGYSRNHPLERMVRDARMFTIGGGTAQILRTLVAGRILGWKLPQTREGYLPRPSSPEPEA